MAKSLEARVEALEKQFAEMKCSSAVKISKKLGVGDTFKLAGLTWKILEITEDGYKCLAERLENSMQFDSGCNNWTASDLRNYLNTEFLKKLEDSVGADKILSFERDLLSMDGQTEYGKCEDKISLLTVDEYRKYRAMIPNAEYWWWTITPDSTPCNDDSRWLRVVSPSGLIDIFVYNRGIGVRPFCIFASSLFESKE